MREGFDHLRASGLSLLSSSSPTHSRGPPWRRAPHTRVGREHLRGPRTRRTHSPAWTTTAQIPAPSASPRRGRYIENLYTPYMGRDPETRIPWKGRQGAGGTGRTDGKETEGTQRIPECRRPQRHSWPSRCCGCPLSGASVPHATVCVPVKEEKARTLGPKGQSLPKVAAMTDRMSDGRDTFRWQTTFPFRPMPGETTKTGEVSCPLHAMAPPFCHTIHPPQSMDPQRRPFMGECHMPAHSPRASVDDARLYATAI